MIDLEKVALVFGARRHVCALNAGTRRNDARNSKAVRILNAESGAAHCESNDEDFDVILFFSDAAAARRVQQKIMFEYKPSRLDLSTFYSVGRQAGPRMAS